ncbi:venom allergen-1-like [Cochliomyia hominivorax]
MALNFIRLLCLIIIIIIESSQSWEYCQTDIKNNLCSGEESHLICDGQNSISNPTHASTEFLAHVPLTRKIKTAFLNWHNYYRNRTAGGWVKNKKNKKYFPKAVRMRELIWDAELSYLSHFRTNLVNKGDVACLGTQRFKKVAQSLIVKTENEPKPILEIVALALREIFDEKNNIKEPTELSDGYDDGKHFADMVNDQVSRLGCAVALGDNCKDNDDVIYKYCYYTACTYDYSSGGCPIYKIGKPARRCSRWGVKRSKMYINLCANSGEIFDTEN